MATFLHAFQPPRKKYGAPLSNDSPLASVGSDGSSSRRKNLKPHGPTVPTLNPLAWTREGFAIGDPESLSATLASEFPVCLVTLAQIYDGAMDIHHVYEIHDLVKRRLTSKVVILAKPGSTRFGNSPREFRDALVRLDQRNIRCVYEPSDELVAFLGTSDNRGGLRNALHRFQGGKLTQSWIATVADPTERHFAGRDVLVFKRGK